MKYEAEIWHVWVTCDADFLTIIFKFETAVKVDEFR